MHDDRFRTGFHVPDSSSSSGSSSNGNDSSKDNGPVRISGGIGLCNYQAAPAIAREEKEI